MDREILFRGKRVDGHGWVEGGIVLRANGQIFIAPIIDASQIIISAVDPDTVGQYTGLQDNIGQQIFEGDVLEYEVAGLNGPEISRAEVVWDDGGWYSLRLGCVFPDPLADEIASWMRVVGNIHDNPETLKEEPNNGKTI